MVATSPTSAPQNLLAAMAQQYAGPLAIPAVQRSEYLAQALQNLQQTGGQNLRTPGALGSNLLADALLQWSRGKTNQELLKQVQGGMGNAVADAQKGIYAPAPGDAGPSGQGLSIGGAIGGSPPAPASAAPISGTQNPLADAMLQGQTNDAVNMAYGEARGEGAPGRQAVIGVAQNRAKLEGLTPSDGTGGLSGALDPTTGQPWAMESPLSQVIREPGQFEGFDPKRHLDPNSPIAKSILADIQPVLDGQASPAGTADHFWSPQAQAQMGRQPPSWGAQGAPQQIGNQQFSSIGFGGQPPLQSPAGGAQLAAAAAPPPAVPPAGGGQPYQVASLGPTPSPPNGGATAGVSGMAPPAAPQGAPAGAAPLQTAGLSAAPQGDQPGPVPQGVQGPAPQQAAPVPGGPPTGPYATPQEQAFIQQHLQYPPGSALWMQGVQKAQEIQQRRMTPMAPPKDMMWGPDGHAIPVPGTQYQTVSSGPGGATQADPFGQYHATANPNSGAIPPGMTVVQGPNGPQLVPMQGSAPRALTDPKERAALGILPADRNSYAMGPDGKVTKVADNPYGPKEIQSVHDNFWGSDETKKAQEAYSAFTGLTGALGNATKNNGPLDQAAMDSFLRGINPGMGARNSTVQMVMDHFGFPQELQGKISGLLGNGFITPQSLQQMAQITHDYAAAHQSAAMARSTADAKMVGPYGYGPSDLAEDLPALPGVPQINFGGAQPGSGVQPGNGAQPAPSGGNRLFPSTLPGQAGAQVETDPARRAALIQRARQLGIQLPAGFK